MAQEIIIDITAKLNDNASKSAEKLENTLKRLEKYKNFNLGNVSLNTLPAQMQVENLVGKFETYAADKFSPDLSGIKNAAETVAHTTAEARVSLETSGFERNIKKAKKAADDFSKSVVETSIKVNDSAVDKAERRVEDIWVDGEKIVLNGESSVNGVSEIKTTGTSTGKHMSYGNSAEEYVNELIELQGQAQEYGLKYKPTASLEDMRKLVWGYEDENFPANGANNAAETDTAKAAENTEAAKLTKAVEKNTKAVEKDNSESGGSFEMPEIPELDDDDEPGSLGEMLTKTAKSMAGNMFGAAAVTKGMNKIAEDIVEGLSAETQNDSARSISRGLTKAGLMGAGALVGSVIPGVGTLLGAGIGSAAGSFFGDDLADLLSGIHKSSEELKDDYIDKYFGSISISASQAGNAVKGLLNIDKWDDITKKVDSLDESLDMRESLDSSLYKMKELGSKITIFDNLHRKVDKDEIESFSKGATQFADDATDTMLSSMFGDLLAADETFGAGSEMAKMITDQYTEAFKNIDKIKLDMSDFIKISGKDGELTPEEIDGIMGYMTKIQEVVGQYSQSQSENDMDLMKLLVSDGSIAYDSLSDMLDDYSAAAEDSNMNYARKLQRNLKAAGNNEKAQDDAWNAYHEGVGNNTAQILTGAVDFTNNTMLGSSPNYLEAEDSRINAYNKSIADSREFIGMGLGDWDTTTGYLANDVRWARGYLGYDDFEKKSPESRGIAAENYSKVASDADRLEANAQKTLERGGNATNQLSALQSLWDLGAKAGDEKAIASLAGASAAQTPEFADTVNGWIANGREGDINQDFMEAFKLFNGNYRAAAAETAEEIQSGNEEVQGALEDGGQGTAEAAEKSAEDTSSALENKADTESSNAADSAAKTAENIEKSAEDTSKALGESMTEAMGEAINSDNIADSNLGEQLMEAMSQSLSSDNMKFEGLDFGQSLMNAIGESLSSDNMSFEGLNIGTQLMEAIGESISTDNMDFSQVDIGTNLMNSISESLSADNMDFGSLDFGQSLMNAVSASISTDNMDFGSLDIGTSLMAGISSSLENIDIGTIDIGSKIMESINSSIQSIDVGSIDIASRISESLNGSSITVSPAITLSVGSIDTSGLSGAIQGSIAEIAATAEANIQVTATVNYTVGMFPTTVPEISGIANYSMGSYPTSAPTISGVANYTGNFPSSAPTLHGTVIYTAIGLPRAKGDMNFPGGMAVINDQTGIADPTELVEHNGVLMEFGGRNIAVPLSQGDKIYTASQRKAMLSNLPHYAGGKNNKSLPLSKSSKNDEGSKVSMGDVHIELNVDARGYDDAVTAIASQMDMISETVVNRLYSEFQSRAANTVKRKE